MKRRRPPASYQSPVWDCGVCIDQMFGQQRCPEHNPTPEQRAADPARYLRYQFAPRAATRKRAA